VATIRRLVAPAERLVGCGLLRSGGAVYPETMRPITLPALGLLVVSLSLACTLTTVNNGVTNTCTASTTVTGCVGNASGYSCTGTATPDQTDATLVCSDGTPSGNATLYCCAPYTASSSSTCAADCTGASIGFSCTGSDTPEQGDSSLVCSTGTAGSGNTLYCCIDNASTSCMQDSTVQGCSGSSVGFSCTGTAPPSQSDSSLTCSTGVAGTNGQTLYCCTQ